MKKLKIYFIVFIALLLSSSAFISCSDSEGSTKENEEENGSTVYVETRELNAEKYVHYFTILGSAKANQRADLASYEGGRIEKIYKPKGTYVSKGEIILEIDNDVLKANLDAAKAQYDLAETNYKRQEKIYSEKVTSELQYLTAKYERDMAKANYELIKNRYDKTFIKAPFAGVVDNNFFEEGEFAPPGVALIALVNLDVIKIEAGVPENLINNVKQGTNAKVIFRDLNNMEFNQKISFVGNTIRPDNRTFPVEIIIPNRDKKIKPELSAIVYIESAVYDEAILVPEEVVQKTDLGYVVFVENDGLANMRKIDIINRSDNRVAVKNGLKGGEKLIVVGFNNLVEGERVTVLN